MQIRRHEGTWIPAQHDADRRAFLTRMLALGGASLTGVPTVGYTAQSHPVWGDLSALERPKPLNKALRIIGGPPALGGEPWPEAKRGVVRLKAYLDRDGKPGDLLVLPPYRRGAPQKLENTEVNIKNFRRVRVIGLHLHVTNPFFGWRRQRHPDGAWIGTAGDYLERERLLNFSSDVQHLRAVDDIFVEGCHLQADNDEPGAEVYPTGDGLTAYGLGWSDSPLDRLVVQNTRIETMGTHNADDRDNRQRSTRHSDNIQLQWRVLLSKLRIENFYGASNYQCLFFPRNDMERRIDEVKFSPTGEPGWSPGRADYRFRRMVLWSPARAPEGSVHSFMAPGGPRYGLDACHQVGLLDDVYCGTPIAARQWRSVITPHALYANPTSDAFREPARYTSAAPITGAVRMFSSLAAVPDFAPANQVGLNYRSPWI